MSYTVTKLITQAYYLSGIVAREFEEVSGPQLQGGLDLLNDILGDSTVEEDLIPYYTSYNFDSVASQQEYSVPDLVKIETMTFSIDEVRYSMCNQGIRQYHGSNRAKDVTSLPYSYNMQRELGGARIFLYFLPDKVYSMELWGFFRLAQVVLNQDLELTLDRFYITFLKYRLAERICTEFHEPVSLGIQSQLLRSYHSISKRSAPMDLTQNYISAFDELGGGVNYGQVNLGRGYNP
jgi:hypothetical protein